jgi:hypothetical protein
MQGSHKSLAAARTAKFCKVTPDICGNSAKPLLLVTVPAPTVLRWPLIFGIFVHLWSKVVKFLMACSVSDRLVSGLGHNYLEVFRGFTVLLGSPIKYQDRIAS